MRLGYWVFFGCGLAVKTYACSEDQAISNAIGYESVRFPTQSDNDIISVEPSI